MGPGFNPSATPAQRSTLSSCLAGIPGLALYFVFWSGGDTGLSAVLCLLVWRGYRAQSCTLSSGLTGIPGSALYFVFFWSGGDTGLSAVLCLLVWRGYRAQSCAFFFLVWRAYLAQRCIFFSGLEGIRGSAKRCTLSSSLAVWRGLGRTACRTRDAALSPRCRVFGGARVFLADIQH